MSNDYQSSPSPSTGDYALLVVLAAIFGLSFTLTRVGVSDIPPLSMAAGRVLLAAMIIYPIMRLSGQRLPGLNRIWLPIIVSSITGYALPFTLVSWGQIQVESGLASIFMAVMPLFTIILAHFFTTDEKLSVWKLLGVLLGLAGIIVLFGLDTLKDITGTNALAQLAIILAAICYAINALVTKALVSVPRLSMLTALLLTSALTSVPLSIWLEQPFTLSPSAQSLMALLLLAIGPTAVATLMILVIIDRRGAGFLSQINFMVPLFGVLFGWIFLNESMGANAWLALALILAGLAVSRLTT